VVPLSLTSVDAPPFGFSMAPDPTEAGRQRNLELTEEIKQAMAPTTAYLRKALRALGATEEPGFIWDDIVALPDRYLQLSPAGFEYPRSDAPKNIRFLGVLPAPTSANEHELPDWWADVERAERVVVVTQGTIANRDLTELIEPALRSLGDLDALVVAATGREDVTIADVPANARVASFIPFDTLLPYTDVLLTNGGFGGVMQAFRHGVPMVLAGDTEDKSENGVHVAWLGAGKNLGTARPDEADIRKAVDQVLGDQSYRHAARRLEAEIASIDTFAVIAAQVDELLG
jgi:UDP:flavonoid glycosyltransferase YjiC (YdhE family)